MTDCPRFGRWIGGCKFSPRYDLGEPHSAYNLSGGTAAALAYINDSLKPKTYVRDVCERCGKTVERDVSGKVRER
jgi:hypothetical protein